MNNIFYKVEDMDSWRVPNPKQLSKEQIKELQRELGVKDDGLIGKQTITALQSRLGVDADGIWGKKSKGAWVDEYNDEMEARFNYNRAKEEVTKEEVTEEEPYTNIEVDNAELAYLNKEIDKVKKQLSDRQANYESVPTPKTQVGWASYIANNDRGMLDKYQDAERAWYNKLIDQEHAKALAKAQMEQQAAYRMDDNMKNRSKALTALQYAKAALKNDTSNDDLIKAGLVRDIRNAEDELKYWNKAVGIEDKSELEDVEELLKKFKGNNNKDNNNERTTAVQIGDYEAIKSFKTQADKDSTLAEMKANPAFNKDVAFKKEYNRIKDITPEDKKAADKEARKTKWKAGMELSGFDYRKWKESPEGKELIKEFGGK